MSFELKLQNKIIMFILFGLLAGTSLAVFPLEYSLFIPLLIVGGFTLFFAYRWPEFFLILSIWTYFLKFTFLFSIGGLGITPSMIFQILALSGYSLRVITGKQRLIFPVGIGFFLLFIVFTTLSLLLIRDLESALGVYFRTILDWVLMFLVIQMVTDRPSINKLVYAILLQGIIVITWGMLDGVLAIPTGRSFTSYNSFFWNQFRKNDFAIYLAFLALLSAIFVMHQKKVIAKLIGGVLLLAAPVAWLVTQSRSGLLAFIVGFLTFLILERNIRLLRLLLILSVLAIISFAAFPSQQRDLAWDGIRAIVDPENVVAERNVDTITLRLELMEAGIEVLKTSPVLGVGFNQWQFYSPITNNRRDARTGERIEDPLEIHNYYLQIATTNGVIALTGYLGFITSMLYSSFRARRKTQSSLRSLLNALIALLIAIHITLSVTTGFLFQWLVFGLLIGVINVAEIENKGDIPKQRWLKLKLNVFTPKSSIFKT